MPGIAGKSSEPGCVCLDPFLADRQRGSLAQEAIANQSLRKALTNDPCPRQQLEPLPCCLSYSTHPFRAGPSTP